MKRYWQYCLLAQIAIVGIAAIAGKIELADQLKIVAVCFAALAISEARP